MPLKQVRIRALIPAVVRSNLRWPNPASKRVATREANCILAALLPEFTVAEIDQINRKHGFNNDIRHVATALRQEAIRRRALRSRKVTYDL